MVVSKQVRNLQGMPFTGAEKRYEPWRIFRPVVSFAWSGSRWNCTTDMDGMGRMIVRVKNREERLDDFRKFVVDFEMDASGEKGEGLEHALNMGIFAFPGFELKTAGDFGITLRELGSGMAEEAQLTFVIEEQIVAQATGP